MVDMAKVWMATAVSLDHISRLCNYDLLVFAFLLPSLCISMDFICTSKHQCLAGFCSVRAVQSVPTKDITQPCWAGQSHDNCNVEKASPCWRESGAIDSPPAAAAALIEWHIARKQTVLLVQLLTILHVLLPGVACSTLDPSTCSSCAHNESSECLFSDSGLRNYDQCVAPGPRQRQAEQGTAAAWLSWANAAMSCS